MTPDETKAREALAEWDARREDDDGLTYDEPVVQAVYSHLRTALRLLDESRAALASAERVGAEAAWREAFVAAGGSPDVALPNPGPHLIRDLVSDHEAHAEAEAKRACVEALTNHGRLLCRKGDRETGKGFVYAAGWLEEQALPSSGLGRGGRG